VQASNHLVQLLSDVKTGFLLISRPAVSKRSVKGIREKLKASEPLRRVNNTLKEIAK
jgi:hypothetical protein